MGDQTGRRALRRYALLSIAAAVTTLVLKTVAYLLTGSVGLLSDALESLVNLAGAMMAFAMLTVAARPADERHPFGHGKAEYFSSGMEGTLILIAAVSIGIAAVQRLLEPRVLEQIGTGLTVSIVASGVNLVVALVILRAGKRSGSITLVANAHHLLTDVWTSVGVVAGVGAVALTGWNALDPIVALLVAANIIWTGVRIVRQSVSGLMDAALSPPDQEALQKVLCTFGQPGVEFHDIRTRQAGARRFVSVHMTVPDEWTVIRAHALADEIEREVGRSLPDTIVDIHIEPSSEQTRAQ